jgi:hypothetical protein
MLSVRWRTDSSRHPTSKRATLHDQPRVDPLDLPAAPGAYTGSSQLSIPSRLYRGGRDVDALMR